jgi:hypothetical protein
MKYFENKECENCFRRSKDLIESNPFFCTVCGHKYDSFINFLPFLLIVLSCFLYGLKSLEKYALMMFPLWTLAWLVHRFSKSLNLDCIDIRLKTRWLLIGCNSCSNGELILGDSGGHFKITIDETKIRFDISRHSCYKNRLILNRYGQTEVWEYEMKDSILFIKAYNRDLKFSSEALKN